MTRVGGEISIRSLLSPVETEEEEPNGGNYERKGMTGNIFRCLDCGLENFQSWVENHKCPAWPEKKRQKQDEEKSKPKLDSGGWLLDK